MERGVGIAAAASPGEARKSDRTHAPPPGSPCLNCGATLAGPYCHQCGQHAEEFHRSLGHLVEESVENLFHLDGRLWRTLPRLLVKPAALTRDYLDGRRAGQIPPIRLFLVVVLIFFFAGTLGGEPNMTFANNGNPVTAADRSAKGGATRVDVISRNPNGAMSRWLSPRIAYAASHRREFLATLESWAHRLAILLLPASALALGLLFVSQRRFYIYDHLIFSMHSLSFMGLLLSAEEVLRALGLPMAVVGWMLLAMPAHLFVHMRGVYGLGPVGTLVRMALLFIMTMLLLFVGVGVLFMVSLSVMPASAAG